MISDEQRKLMLDHLDLVIEMNKAINLTRIDNREEGTILHIEDSLAALNEIESAPEGKLADMGSGGGFPGIPLAIATGRSTTLIEMRKKKADSLQCMIDSLGLSDSVDVYCGRAELLARLSPASFAVVTARALSKLSVLMELASPLLVRNGVLVCYKAHIDEEEYENARLVQAATGMRFVSDREVVVGDGSIERRIICFKKTGQPKMKLPRKEGMAQNQPL